MISIVLLTGMGLRSLAGRPRRDRALVLDLLGGSVTSLAGVVAYFLVPFLTGEAASLGDAFLNGAVDFGSFSPLYHAVVLVVAPFLITVAVVLAARKRGLSTRTQDLKVVGGIVSLPLLTTIALYFLIAVGFGLAAGLRVGELELYERVMGAAGFTAWALIFGVFFLVFVAAAVLVGELVGAGSGYLPTRRLSRR
jgi:hypothetical protein